MGFKTFVRRMKKSPLFIIGFLIIASIIILCFTSPLYIRWDPLESNLTERFCKPDYFANGLAGHPFGTDALGRDIFSRLVTGGRISMVISLICTVICAILISIFGLVSGYFGGWVDKGIMRLCDIMMSVPALMLAACIVAMLGNGYINLIITMTITAWPIGARITRANTMSIKNKEFVHASKLMGASNLRIMLRDIFPNVLTPIIIQATTKLGNTVLVESSLSYLGLGVQLPTPSWGNMIAEGRNYLLTSPWVVIIPGIMLMLTVLGFNFLGDGIRDILDPKNKD